MGDQSDHKGDLVRLSLTPVVQGLLHQLQSADTVPGPYFIDEFRDRAVALAHLTLDRNKEVALSERQRFAERSGPQEVKDASYLRQVASHLAQLQYEILVQYNAWAGPRRRPYVQPDKFDKVLLESSTAKKESGLIANPLLPTFELVRHIYGLRFPVLLVRNTDFKEVAEAGPDELPDVVASRPTRFFRRSRPSVRN